MQHLKILVVCTRPPVRNGVSEAKLLIAEAAKQIKLPLKDLAGFIDVEDVVSKTHSLYFEKDPDQYGYVIAIGKQSIDKTKDQIASAIHNGSQISYTDIPTGFPAMAGESREQAVEVFKTLLNYWRGFNIERMIDAKARAEQPETSKPTWILGNLADFKRYLNLEVANSRWQACIWQWDDDPAPTLEIVDATRKLRYPLKATTPVLVSGTVLKDPTDVHKALRDANYEDPYLITVDSFIFLIELYCRLASEGEAHVKIKANKPNHQDQIREAIKGYCERADTSSSA